VSVQTEDSEDVLFISGSRVSVKSGEHHILLTNSQNEQFHLEDDFIGISYLFRICQELTSRSPVAISPTTIDKESDHNQKGRRIIDASIRKELSYDRVFEIIMNQERVIPEKHVLNLADEEWREIFLEVFRSRKTYAGGIIQELLKSGLPIDDVQIGRVLRNMRESGFIRGDQRKSKKSGNNYFLLTFPPYVDNNEPGDD